MTCTRRIESDDNVDADRVFTLAALALLRTNPPIEPLIIIAGEAPETNKIMYRNFGWGGKWSFPFLLITIGNYWLQ